MTDPLRVLIDGEFVDIERADVDVDADLELAEEDVPPLPVTSDAPDA